MAIVFDILGILIIVLCVAFLRSEGLWGSLLTLFNVIFAGLLAMNFWEPAANLVEGYLPRFSYLLDFIMVWVIFLAACALLRGIARLLSGFQVRFRKPLELAGGYLVSAFVGWVLLCFVVATLHLAPLPPVAFWGGFDPGRPAVFGLAPDIKWLGFARQVSLGSLGHGEGESRAFDPDATLIHRYQVRRAEFATQDGLLAPSR